MKYLKKFERSYVKNVWIVPIKMPDFEIALWKIGMNEKDIMRWIGLNKLDVFTDHGKYPNRETITMSKDSEYNVSDSNVFTWYWFPTSESSEYYIFMGKIEITTNDIQEYKNYLEMKKNAKKYNI